MKHQVYSIKNREELTDIIQTQIDAPSSEERLLIQVFGAQECADLVEITCETFYSAFPSSTVFGTGSSAQIAYGRTLNGCVAISVMTFQSATFESYLSRGEGKTESEMAHDLARFITHLPEKPKCLLLSCTALSLDAFKLTDELNETLPKNIPILGGGVGSLNFSEHSFLWLNGQVSTKGNVMIALLGENLEIFSKSYLGWKAFSQEMSLTKTEGKWVHEIDGRPASEMYERYLGIKNDVHFLEHINGFPLLYDHNDDYLARVPIVATDSGSLLFLNDQSRNKNFRLGYADPTKMVATARLVQDELNAFNPDAILIYSCISRARLLGDDVDLETYPYDLIAPVAGFYTVGEFQADSGKLQALNSAIVVLGLRESGGKTKESTAYEQWREGHTEEHIRQYVTVKDPHAVARLVHFISVVTEELKESNRALALLSTTDKLTQIYNRFKLDEILHQELSRSNRYGSHFSVLLLDVDHFKKINDEHGHLIGDEILVAIVNVLKNNLVRASDCLGRWGGEEFLIILPEQEMNQAIKVAIKLCRAVDQSYFIKEIHPTCSFGVTSFRTGDTEDSLLSRVDEALFRAKALGRNRVEYL